MRNSNHAMKNRLFWILMLWALQLNSAAQTVTSTTLPTQNQLPVGDVQQVFQDSEGYMWYGTEGGLCRDDGYRITVFHADSNNPGLLKSNHITCIAEDTQQRIWFGTKRGAYILNKKDNTITPLTDEKLDRQVIHTINVFSDGSIWVSVDHELYRYTVQQKCIGTYDIQWEDSPKHLAQMYEDDRHTIWMIQWRGGIFRYDPGKDTFHPYPWPFSYSPSWMLKDKKSPYYWVGTWEGGIVRFDPDAKDMKQMYRIQYATTKTKKRDERKISSIAQDSVRHCVWVTTSEDLYAYTISESDTLMEFPIHDVLPEGRKILNQVMTDRLSNIWVASSYPHSFILSFQNNAIFRNSMPKVKEALGIPPALQRVAYEEGFYWIWQKKTGLCLYRPDTNELIVSRNRKLSPFFEKYRHGKGIYAVMQGNIVLSIQYVDNQLKESEIVTLQLAEDERIRTMYEDESGNIWLGTTYNLFRYNQETKRLYKEWENTGIINDVISLSDGTVYIATETNGILRLTVNKKKNSYPSNENCLHLAKTVDQTVWAGTLQGGVYCYDRSSDQFLPKMKEIGLSKDLIHSLEGDQKGYMWILTDQKITIYNPVEETSYIVRNSDHSVQMNNFMSLSSDQAGGMYVGGVGGILKFSSFQPFNLSAKEYPICLTAIKVGDDTRLCAKDTKRIQLQPQERNIELFFSTFDPLNTNKIRYAFRYKGKKMHWNYIPEGQNNIYLTELLEGNYELEIKATNRDGTWYKNTLTVLVQRLPAWYETWWANTLYILCALLLLLYLMRKYIARQKEKQHLQMEEEVAQMKYQFFTNVSHELRTPLTLIITPLETLVKKVSDTDIRQQLELIGKNAQNLLTLVNQLLDFRKIEMGGETLLLAAVDLNEMLRSSWHNFQLAAKEKGIDFNYHSPQGVVMVAVDSDKIRKIVNNLLSNAFKFTDQEGKITLSLRKEMRENREYVVIEVEDTGRGIPSNSLTTIFERFHQIDTSEKEHVGSGIGLHLVKQYVTLHQGEVIVHSQLKKGSRFVVYIPTDLQPKEIKSNPVLKEEAEEAPASDSRKKILLVEDNADFRAYLKNELNSFYTVYEAVNGEEGEREALDKEPDIVITDLAMPKMNGIELCRRIKNTIKISHIPIILLTANTNIEYEKQGYKEGADAYITKPFHWDILLSRIQNLIERTRQRQQEFKEGVEVSPASVTISSIDEQLLEKAFEWVEKNIDNAEYSIEDFSRDMGMSRVNLYRKLHSITGLSPTEFVSNVRLKRAAQLLDQGNMTVVEVSYSVGFSTPSYFTKSFKKMFGVLPTQYKMRK